MTSHSRRRSRSSSDSSCSPSPGDTGHRKEGEMNKDWKHGGSSSQAAQRAPAGVPQATSTSYSQPSSAQHPTMSGPGFPNVPSNPPPYSFEGPSYEGQRQGTMSMPGSDSHVGGFAPPPGLPPSFSSAHGPGFPSAEFEKAGYNASPGAPEFPASPHDAPGFPTSPHDAPSFPTSPHDSPSFPTPPHDAPGFPGGSSERGFPGFPHDEKTQQQQQQQRRPPPSGVRIPLTAGTPFPQQQAGPPVALDADGRSPIYLGSALFDRSVHPCKIAPALTPPCRVPYGGGEFEHHGRFDLLPFDAATMEWVHTARGRVPEGRRPVEGGYEEHGGKLYHALAEVQGVKVPGKTGEHLSGCNVAFGGGEHVVREYDILCWRF